MQGLLTERAKKFTEQHKNDSGFGEVTVIERYPYPIEGLVDGNIPVTISHLGNLTKMSTSQLCTDAAGTQTWVEINAVALRERNFLPNLTVAEGKLVGAGSGR